MVNRWDPFADLVSLREAMDRLFDQSFIRLGRGILPELAGARTMPIDLYERDGDYIIKAYLPGVKAEDVDINVDQGTLTIKAHIPGEAEREEAKSYRCLTSELSYGDVTRTIALPAMIDAGRIEATVENGVLTLIVPKAEAAKPKKITVKAK